MSFPVYLHVGSLRIHPHLLFEALAYAVGFRVYLELRRQRGDRLQDFHRWWVIAAAAIGAVLGSKLLFLLEDPRQTLQHITQPALLFSGKTIVGAFIGGLFSVEFAKRRLGVTARTGDLFALPLCTGIAIGRIGCFLTGIDDQTAGIVTTLPWGVNFGDGIRRHPTQLYEVVFVLLLGMVILSVSSRTHQEGDLFKIFMAGYFAFRLACDFLKPEFRILAGLSSIQWACVAMLLYYFPDMLRWVHRESYRRVSSPSLIVESPAASALNASAGTSRRGIVQSFRRFRR
jgi:phosphatidylglycerol:prolipoprotein diacylglycerol transferase